MVERITAISNTDLKDPQKVRSGALELEGLILDGPLSQNFALGSDIVERLQRLYERFETDLEYDFAEKIIKGEVTLEQYPLYQRFQCLIKAEVELASITDRDRVLFIGGGPLPISAILVSQFTLARVDCFDKSPQAAAVSEKVIQRLGLNERIRILNAGGDTQKISGYDIILVALLAQPKSEILQNIQCLTPQGTRVICRTSEGDRQVFYKPTNPTIYESLGRYQLIGKHTAGVDDTISSLLFRMAGNPLS